MTQVTIFKNIFSKEPHYISVDRALARIQNGQSEKTVIEVRAQSDKESADRVKRRLPGVCFSGKFGPERLDESIIEHSGYMVLDFDNVLDLRNRQAEIISHDFVKACWISPRANGLKTLVKIADGNKHRDHFNALRDYFPDADKSGVNPSRVCYESFDPDIYIRPDNEVKPFAKIKIIERVEQKQALENEQDIFSRILKWINNSGSAFVTGERNLYIFKLASACCRFGIQEDSCFSLCSLNILSGDTSFTVAECQRTIKSAYKSNRNKYASASFERDILVDTVTRKEVKIEIERETIIDLNKKAKDVIYAADVKQEALNIFRNGYKQVDGIGIPDIDYHFKFKRQEVTCLSGIGNYGKSSFLRFLLMMRAILFKEKFALFCPEDFPPDEFYHELTELLLGCDCTPSNPHAPKEPGYDTAYDFVGEHFFFVYPKELAPTPEYIKECFLELVLIEKVDGVVIDPFNQMYNDYGSAGGRTDKYLETFLSDCGRFARLNNVFFLIVLHPKLMQKEADGNYRCPDIFDLADGAMWNNKADNILIYHRPNHQKDPSGPLCEMHSKKIRRQKIVGVKGTATFELARKKRRFVFNGDDPMEKALLKMGLKFIDQPADLWNPANTGSNELPF